MSDFKIDDWVRILDVYPHENCGRIATVGRIQENGDVVVYFGDQDEDEWVYASSELEKRPALQLDVDTLTKGVKGPFEPWESDHTALVHVLWAAKRSGLSLDDADEIASRILQSRWAAAYRTQTLQNLRKDHT
jgi:hypothetical protein